MLHRRVLGFILFSAVFLYAGRQAVRAYTVMFPGRVLGAAGAVEYTYVVRALPSPTALPPDAPTATPVPPTPTPTAQSFIAAGLEMLGLSSPPRSTSLSVQSLGDNNGNDNNNGNHNGNQGGNSSPTLAPTAVPTQVPTKAPTPIPKCGVTYCNDPGKICYLNFCRDACDAAGKCLGAYRCENGACVPDATVRSPQTGAPQPPSVPDSTTQNAPPPPATSPEASPPPAAPPADTPVPPTPKPTNTPYPTFAPKNKTFYDNTSTSKTPQAPIPVVPDSLKGDKSTIIVELPPPPADPARPNAPVPAPTLMVFKGEDMKSILIGLAKPAKAAEPETPGKAQSSTPTQSSPDQAANLDIQIQDKKGSGFAVSQQQFIIQRGVQQALISANEREQGTLVLEKNDTKARITMPLSIDPTTNILTVQTPSGPMKVAIMPDDAVAISRQLKVIDKNGEPQDIALETRSGSLEYHIKAVKEQKLLFVIPVSVPREVYITADTGSLSQVKQSGLWNFLTLFTF